MIAPLEVVENQREGVRQGDHPERIADLVEQRGTIRDRHRVLARGQQTDCGEAVRGSCE